MDRHGGYDRNREIRYDFSINVNPLGTPASLKNAMEHAWEKIEKYPDFDYYEIRQALLEHEIKCGHHFLTKEQILLGNGASELILAFFHGIMPKRVLLQAPSFSGYERAAKAVSARIFYMTAKAEKDFCFDINVIKDIESIKPEMVVLCNPSNPVGNRWNPDLLEQICKVCEEQVILLVVDECFLEFTENYEIYSLLPRFCKWKNVVVIKAFTKLYSVPGLRLGYAYCGKTEIANNIQMHLPEWNLSTFAVELGIVALQEEQYVRDTTLFLKEERAFLKRELEKLGFRVFPSEANYLLFLSDVELKEPLLKKGILIRKCDNYYGLEPEGYYRVAVRTREENLALLEELKWLRKS